MSAGRVLPWMFLVAFTGCTVGGARTPDPDVGPGSLDAAEAIPDAGEDPTDAAASDPDASIGGPDSGPAETDAGSHASDAAGSAPDAGAPSLDAGAAPEDAATPGPDAGSSQDCRIHPSLCATAPECHEAGVCDATGRCVFARRPTGAACPDDGQECTDDVCSAASACTHPARADGTACQGTGTCRTGVCSTCLATESACGNGVDEDCDGRTDCADPECQATVCPTARLEVEARDLTLSVDDAGSSDPDGSLVSHRWDFGDGTASEQGRTPRLHTFAAPGSYVVTLTVTDDHGRTGRATKPVAVAQRTLGAAPPDDASTGVPAVVADRLYLVDLEKPNKSATNTPSTGEETLVIGQSGASYTFTRNGAALTLPSEHAYVTATGLVLDRLHLRGYLEVRAPQVTLRRSIVEAVRIPDAPVAAPPAGINSGRRLVRGTSGLTVGLVLEDLEVRVPTPVQRGTGVSAAYHHSHGLDASRFTLRRSEVAGTVDGMQVFAGSGTFTDARVETSWIHDLQFYDLDADRTDGDHSHNDAIQVECSLPASGQRFGVQIVGNALDLTNDPNLNACLMATRNACATAGLRFDDNWCDGASAPFNVGGGTSDRSITLYANRNRFGPNRGTGTVPKTWKTSFTDKVMAVKSNTDGGAAWDNHDPSRPQLYVYFSFEPPGSLGAAPPSAEGNGNTMVDHPRTSQTWGTTSRGTAGVGLW